MLCGAVTAFGSFAQRGFDDVRLCRTLSAFCGKHSEIPRAGRVPIEVVRRWATISEGLDCAPLPAQRAAFVEALSQLFVCAGEPTLQKVADWATEAQRRRNPRAPAVKHQRLSDWCRGKSLPQQFESFEPVARVLIGDAIRTKVPPTIAGLYELGQWRKWWHEARTAPDDPTGRPPQTPSPTCPYQGLAAFETADQDRFFGRTRSIDALVAFITKTRTTDPGIVLLTGPSGAGKSSLLSAGLAPAVSSGALNSDGEGGWVSARMTPGNDPMAELARCLDQPDINERAEGVGLLIIVDQAEEIFGPDVSVESRTEFLNVLHAMCQPSTSAPAVVVMGLRADVLGRCVEVPELADAVQSRSMILGPMTRAELRDAITKPAKMAKLSIEPGLVEIILNDLVAEEKSSQAARLPLLSHVLVRTWKQRRDSKLTVAGYRLAGKVRGSVAATGEDAWCQLDEAQRKIARSMLMRLITIGEAGYDTCRREPKHELLARFADADNAADVLEILTAARLLTIHDGDVMFTHEIVLRAWVRLAGWIESERAHAPIRQRAETDAAAWIEKGRPSSFLQTGARLEATLTLLTDNQEADQSVAEFAEASRRHQRRVTKRKRGAIVIVSILAVVATLAAGVAFWQRNAMSRQRSTIARQYDTAVFNQVLAAADARQLSDPSLSAQLSLVAHHLRPNDGQVRSRLLATENVPLSTQLTGHSSEVSSVMFSPDGNLLASASWDNTIRLWNTSNLNNPQLIGQPLRGHANLVSSVAFSPDGKTLASSSRDNTVRLWDLTTPTDIKELTAPLTGGGALYMVAFSPDGRTLAAASDDRTVRLWDVTDRRAPHAGPILSGHTGPVWAVAFSPNGHTLASAGNDRSVRLWDVADPARAQQAGPPLTGFTDITYAVAFDPAGSMLAVSGQDGVIRLWDVTDPAHPIRVADPLPAHNEAAWYLEFSPDGTTLASASYDGTAKLWNLLDPARPVALGQPLADANGGLTWVTFHPGGHHLATSGTSGTVSLWTLPTGVVPNHVGSIDSPAFSADGTVMATASDNVVQLWTNDNHLTRAAILRLPDSSQGGYDYQARVDPGGRILATALGSAPTVLWDISDTATPIKLGTLPNTAKDVSIVAFSPDGRTLATAGDDSSVQLWDITEPRRPRRLSAPLSGFTGFIKAVTFSPDGRTVVAGSKGDYSVRTWDISDRDHPIPSATAITGHTGGVVSVSISPDGTILATGGRDQTIRLWDITDPLHATPMGNPLHSHKGATQVVFSPDGKTLASGGDDGRVLLWNVSDRARPAAIGDSLIPPGVASRTRVAFDPHGRLYAASRDGTIRIWDLDTDNTTRICATTRNVLTEQRWNQVLHFLPYNPPCQPAAK
jgi:WD40 repeat protein